MMDWPPLIVATRKSGSLLLRDRLLTVCIWGGFIYLLVDQSVQLWSSVHHVRTVYPGAFVENWDFRLKPYAVTAGLLMLWLVLFGFFSLHKWKRMIRVAAKPPLSIEKEAERRGMTVEKVLDARAQKIVTIAIDADSRFSTADGLPTPRAEKVGE